MKLLELPHTHGCLVCGRANPHGLKLSLHVNPETGVVTVDFRTRPEHIGFEGIIHGGIVATVMDEAMVWCAAWRIKRFCVCGEMTVRFRSSAKVNENLRIETKVETARSRLITTTCLVTGADGNAIAEGSGKYVPMGEADHARAIRTLMEDDKTLAATSILGWTHGGAGHA